MLGKGWRMKATTQHQRLYDDVCNAMAPHEKEGMNPMEMLAVISKISGRIIACLDPTTVTSDMAMEVVAKNLALGNQEMQEILLKRRH